MWILLIWGRQERERQLGYVADFCPVCRQVQDFVVHEMRMAKHFWFIPLERGSLVGEFQTCRQCGLQSGCNLTRFLTVSRAKAASVETLMAKTFPALPQVYAERLALEERIARGDDSIDASTRMKLMMEVFCLAEPHFGIGYGHMGRRILARALRPLWPKEDEIRACLQRFRGGGSRMGMVRTADVMVSIYPESEEKRPGSFEY